MGPFTDGLHSDAKYEASAVYEHKAYMTACDRWQTFPQSAIERMTLAGFPPTRVFGGTSLVTTEPAATTELSPTVTPPMMVAPAAIHPLFHIPMGFPIVAARRCKGSRGWPVVMMLTFGPIITSSAMSRPPRS